VYLDKLLCEYVYVISSSSVSSAFSGLQIADCQCCILYWVSTYEIPTHIPV